MKPLNYNKRELKILEILWRTNGTDSAEIINELPGKKLAFSTVSMSLRMMKNKGLIQLCRDKNKYVYTAVSSREEFIVTISEQIITDYFSGSPKGFLKFLLDNGGISLTDLKSLISPDTALPFN